MQVTIPPRLEAAIKEAIASGRYLSVDDVMSEALTRWADREGAFASLKAMIEAAEALGGEHDLDDVEAEIEAELAAIPALTAT